MNMKSYYYLSLMLCALSAGVSAQEITKSTDVESERTLSADSIITQDKQLDSLYQSLPEVMITGQRPKRSKANWCTIFRVLSVIYP